MTNFTTPGPGPIPRPIPDPYTWSWGDDEGAYTAFAYERPYIIVQEVLRLFSFALGEVIADVSILPFLNTFCSAI